METPMVTTGPGSRVREMFGEERAHYLEIFMNVLWANFHEGTEEFEFHFKFKPRGKDPKKYDCLIHHTCTIKEGN